MASSDAPGNHDSLDQVIASYLQAVESGQPPDRAAFLAKHPGLADKLRGFFADYDRLGPNATAFHLPNPESTVTAGGAAASLPTVRYLGDYELLSEIARGGMGVVFRARQVSLNRPVAVKMILAGTYATESAVQRFRAEAEAAANLDHPNILPIYEVGEHEGHQYFSMKLITGTSLTAKLAELKANPGAIATLMSTLARAIHFAHQRGILHRDLKPGNVLLDADGTPYIADFGLAKKVDSDDGATRTGAVLGTPSYMAPEQARGEKGLTTAVDVYSLGVILYELLAGRPPFKNDVTFETIKQVLEKEPPDPRSFDPSADRDLSVIALKCLQKDPARRYASAGDLADDFDRWTRGEPIEARPVGRVHRFWKLLARNPVVSALAASVLLAVLAGAGVSVWYAIQAREQAADALLKKVTVEHREEVIRDLLAVSSFEQAQARRLAGQPGWKARSLELLKSAEDLAARPRPKHETGIELPAVADVRGEIIATHCRMDVRPGQSIPRLSVIRNYFSGDGRRVFFVDEVGNRPNYSGKGKVVDLDTGAVIVDRTFPPAEREMTDTIRSAVAVDWKGERFLAPELHSMGVMLYSLPDFKKLASLPPPPREGKNPGAPYLNGADFSPDGRWLLASFDIGDLDTRDGVMVRALYDLNAPTQPPKIVERQPVELPRGMEDSYDESVSVRFSPDSRRLAIRSADGKTINVYDVAKLTMPQFVVRNWSGIGPLLWLPDNRRIVFRTNSKKKSEIVVYDVEAGSVSHTFPGAAIEQHPLMRYPIALRGDGLRLATIDAKHIDRIAIHDLATGQMIETLSVGDGTAIMEIGWTAGGRLYADTMVGPLQLWEFDDLHPAVTQLREVTTFAPCATSDGRLLALGKPMMTDAGPMMGAAQLQIIDRITWQRRVAPQPQTVLEGSFSTDGKRFAMVSNSHVTDYEVPGLALGKTRTSPYGHPQPFNFTASWNAAGHLISVVEDQDMTYHIVDLTTQKSLAKLVTNTKEDSWLPSQGMSGDGRLFFVRMWENTPQKPAVDRPWAVHDAVTGKLLRTFTGGSEPYAYYFGGMIANCADTTGSRLLSGHRSRWPDGQLRDDQVYWTIRDTTTGEVLLRVEDKQTGFGMASLSPDGNWAVVPARTGEVHLWEVDAKAIYARWKPFDGKPVVSANFLADGSIALVPNSRDQILILNPSKLKPILPGSRLSQLILPDAAK